MFSKPLIFAAFAGSSSVFAATGISIETDAYTATWGCAKCLRNSQTFIIPTASVRGTVSDNTGYQGKCCTSASDSTNCASLMTVANTKLAYSVGTNSLEVLMGQCEYNTAVCSSSGGNADSSNQYRGIDGIGDTEVTLTMSGSYLAAKDQCSWVVKVECGAPGLKINSSTTVDATKAILSFVDYSNQFNTVDGITLEGTAPADVWLPKDQKPVYYDMTYPNGEYGTLKFEYNYGGMDNVWKESPGRIIHEQHDWIIDSYKLYTNFRSNYYNTINKLKREHTQTTCWWPEVFGSDFLNWCSHDDLPLPHPRDMSYLLIDKNSYKSVNTNNVMIGYGKLTAGAFHTIASDGGRSYGVNGEDDKDVSGTRVRYDNNQMGVRMRKETGRVSGTGGCDDSYMMVSMIPLADSAGDTLSVTISSEKWKDDLASPQNSYPSPLIEDRGQDIVSSEGAQFFNKAVLVGSIATLFTLY